MKAIDVNRNYLKHSEEIEKYGNYVPNHHIVELAGRLTPETKRAYMSDVKQFFNISDFSELTVEMVQSVTPAKVNQYAEALLKAGRANSTISRKLQALNKFYKYMCSREVGIMDYNPFSPDEGAVRLKTKKYSNTRALTDDEVRSIIKVISEDRSILGLRNKILILLLATTGMRRKETASITIGQIGINKGEYVIDFSGKGRKDRFVVIAKSIKNYIDQYLQIRGVNYMDINVPLFVNHSSNASGDENISPQTIYNVVKSVAKKAGLDASTISPHCFRHTYITNSLDMGLPIEDIQDRVGHSDVGSTRRYDHTRRMLKDNPADEFANRFDV